MKKKTTRPTSLRAHQRLKKQLADTQESLRIEKSANAVRIGRLEQEREALEKKIRRAGFASIEIPPTERHRIEARMVVDQDTLEMMRDPAAFMEELCLGLCGHITDRFGSGLCRPSRPLLEQIRKMTNRDLGRYAYELEMHIAKNIQSFRPMDFGTVYEVLRAIAETPLPEKD